MSTCSGGICGSVVTTICLGAYADDVKDMNTFVPGHIVDDSEFISDTYTDIAGSHLDIDLLVCMA